MNPYIATLAVTWVGTVVILLIINAANRSKVGYQDEAGFHYGEPMPKV